jgi:hypothetical protein
MGTSRSEYRPHNDLEPPRTPLREPARWATLSAEGRTDDVAFLQSLMPLGEVARFLGIHVATVYRWTGLGCRGVTCQSIQRGASRCTTREWLAEFFARLTAARQNPAPPVGVTGPAPVVRTPTQFDKGAAEAGAVLDTIMEPPGGRRPRPRNPQTV